MSRRPKLLVIDDGDRYIELAHALLRDYDYATRCDLDGPCWTCPQRAGCTLTHAHHAREADDALAKHPDTDVVLLDVAFDIDEASLVGADGPLERRRWPYVWPSYGTRDWTTTFRRIVRFVQLRFHIRIHIR